MQANVIMKESNTKNKMPNIKKGNNALEIHNELIDTKSSYMSPKNDKKSIINLIGIENLNV